MLVTGGRTTEIVGLDGAELYDAVTGVWTGGRAMTQPRAEHTVTLLQDGRTLVPGDTDNTGRAATSSTAEVDGAP